MRLKLHLEVLPSRQRWLWERLQKTDSPLRKLNFYLAGGTALALQLGHRHSEDFDFFSLRAETANPVQEWLERLPGWILREKNASTLHAQVKGVKISFIGNYRYPTVKKTIKAENLELASMADIGLMKLLAVTHRAALRDYIDLAAIIRDHIPLEDLLNGSRKKYGRGFNPMISLKALVSFQDLDKEMPFLLDKSLGREWQKILTSEVKKLAN